MSIRNLDILLQPKSIALVGASEREGSVGAVLARNLFAGGFEGPIWPVNPKHPEVQGHAAYRDVDALPAAPDLAVIATPPRTVPGIVEALGARGTKAAIVITAGFGEGGDEDGLALRQAVLDAARPHLMRIVGPNCVGVLAPNAGVNASFAHIGALPGKLAFVAQSGAVVTSVLDWATSRGIGFSQMVSLGGMADVDFGDMLDYLARDPDTSAVLMYVEGVTQARKFMSAARACARNKPVIAIKAGRHAAAAKAAASHTGALAGADAVYDAAFRRAGILRVYDMEEVFDAVETLALARHPRGDRLAILSNGGGVGVLATDALIDEGGTLAELAPATIERLDAALPATWSHGNPVDIIGDAPGTRFAAAAEALAADRGVDGLVVLDCPVAVVSPSEAARAVIDTGVHRRLPVLTSWLGGDAPREARRMFVEAGIPTYETPRQAVRAFMHLVRYRRSQEALLETPPAAPDDTAPDTAAARRTIDAARAEGREWLSEHEAKAVLDAYGIPVARTVEAVDAEAAAAAAEEIGAPVALKILSPDITHKSDMGGVMLDLSSPAAVREAAAAMRERVARAAPEARIEGFTVQAMVDRSDAFELIVGLSVDPQFGPVVLFGHGGTAVEVVGDTALALPPLNMALAHAAMRRTRIHRLLEGYRDRPPVALDAVAQTLIRVAQLAADLPALAELDINPLLAAERGVTALDARIRIAPVGDDGGDPTARFAIKPYPVELEETVTLGDGSRLILRPIRPEDEPRLRAGFEKLDPEDIRMRFFAPMKRLSHQLAARLSQIDYDREMAFVLVDPGAGSEEEGYGVARLTIDPDFDTAEYAIIVRSDRRGLGLGPLLMRRLIDYARGRGVRRIVGDVLAENRAMLRLCESLGFEIEHAADEPNLVHVSLTL